MESEHIGYFAFAENHEQEIWRLYRRWRESLDNQVDDKQLRHNELYQYGRDVASHRAELSGSAMYDAFVCVAYFVYTALLKKKQDSIVLPPDVTRAAMAALERLETRAGEDGVVERIARRTKRISPDDIRTVYRAFRDVLSTAAAGNMGLLSAMHDDNAEAALAERRRQREIARKEAEELARRPRQPGPSLAEQLDTYIERELVRREREAWARSETMGKVRLAHVPAGAVDGLRGLMAELDELSRQGRVHELDERTGQVVAAIEACALRTVVLRTQGQYWALEALVRLLHAGHGDALEPTGVFTPAEVRALRAALRALEEEQGGEDAVIARLAGNTETQAALAPRTYRAFKRAVGGAARSGHALVWLFDERRGRG